MSSKNNPSNKGSKGSGKKSSPKPPPKPPMPANTSPVNAGVPKPKIERGKLPTPPKPSSPNKK